MNEEDIQYMNRAIFTDGRGYLPGPAQPLTVAMLRAANDEIDRQAAVEFAGFRFRVDPACPSGMMYLMSNNAPVISWTVNMDPDNFGAELAPPDHVDALMDLARNDREQDFRDLALMVGVEREQIDALWAGTVKRLKGGAA